MCIVCTHFRSGLLVVVTVTTSTTIGSGSGGVVVVVVIINNHVITNVIQQLLSGSFCQCSCARFKFRLSNRLGTDATENLSASKHDDVEKIKIKNRAPFSSTRPARSYRLARKKNHFPDSSPFFRKTSAPLFFFSFPTTNDMQSPQPIVVCSVDFGPKSFSYWIGQLTDPGAGETSACAVKFLAWRKFPLSDDSKLRETEMIRQVIQNEPYFYQVTHWVLELQNPTNFMSPSMVRKIASAGNRSIWARCGNAITYGLARSMKTAIEATRAARNLTPVPIDFAHPRRKFTVFGLERPPTKHGRKAKMVRFIRAFLRHYHGQFRQWKTWFDSLDKQDDAADSAGMGLAKMIDLVAKQVDLRKLKQNARREGRTLATVARPTRPIMIQSNLVTTNKSQTTTTTATTTTIVLD